MDRKRVENADGPDADRSLQAGIVYRKLAGRVLIALCLIGVLATAEFVISRVVVDSQGVSAQLINISGRQRMLSQRIAALAEEAAREAANHGTAREATSAALHVAIEQMREGHQTLTNGDEASELPPPASHAAAYYFDSAAPLDGQVREFLDVADRIEKATRTGLAASSDLEYLAKEARLALLQRLDGAVQLYQDDAQDRTANLTFGLWAAMMACLVLSGLFVLWPAIRLVRSSMERAESARLMAEQANEAKTKFLSSMSHEIRTPMNGIIGMADLLASEPLEPTQKRYAEIVRRSARSLLAILNDILDVSKMEADQLVLEKVPFNLSRLIMESSEVFGSDCSEKGLDLSLEIEPALDIAFLGDPTRIRQILTNLISNALKFTKEGGVTIRAHRVYVTDDLTEIRIEVKDTGVGFDPDVAEYLFEAFTQEDQSTTRRFGGTGLGLAIVKRIVTAMGGAVRAEGAPGKGATFIVDLPLELSDEPLGEDLEREAAVAEESEELDWSAARLLVAEDNETNRELIGTLLTALGCGFVDFAEDGVIAVQKAGSTPYDLILMDSQMPNMDGIEAAKTIRQTDGPNAGAPIVALTADALDRARERYLGHGFDDYLPKPIGPNMLYEVLGRFIRNPGAADADKETEARTP